MIRRVTAMTMVACVSALVFAVPGVVASASATSSTLTYHFTDCSGPEGTPATFDAVKQPGGAAALHVVESRAIFVAMEAVDVASGDVLFTTPGFGHNGLATVTCRLVHPVTLTLQRVAGLLTAAG
jgi:hypothetical protein